MKKQRSFFFFLMGVTMMMFFTRCASRTVNNIGAYDLSYPDSQQSLLIIPRQITIDAIDGDTVQWNWNNIETRVTIPSGLHTLSVKKDKKIIDITFDFIPHVSYTFSTKKSVVSIIEADTTH